MTYSKRLHYLRTLLAALVSALFFFPIYWWLTVSLKSDTEIFALPPLLFDFEVTLDSYKEVILGITSESEALNEGTMSWGGGNYYMLPTMLDSVFIALASTFFAISISTFAAYALSRMRFKGQQHYIFWILSTRMMPPVAVAIPMFLIFKNFSLLDTYTGVIIVHTLMNLPLSILLIKSFIDDLPIEVDEVALVDGASRWLIFRKLIFPMVRGGVAAAAVLCFIFSWTEFLFVLSLTQTSVNTIPVMSSTFVTSTGTAWGAMAALGTAATIPAFIFILLVQKHLVRGLTMGSLKS
ncbi:carbohydrate ABC transporter permease [Parasalinivibrio latis]|uniref:carbohydrate ABC transporter permease n=1 Tax=Parasalinivibrio latis TaxID=2952610 RepID=UPI0030E377CD